MIEGTATLPHGAEQIGETTARTLISDAVGNIEGVNYLDAPLAVYQTRQYGDSRFDIVVDHAGLDGRQLLGLLNATAPHDTEQDIEGVIGDWNVVDRAEGGRSDNKISRDLVRLHKQLGGPWVEFMRSRRAFLAALEDARTPNLTRYGAAVLLSQEAIDNKSERDILSVHARSMKEMTEVLNKLGAEGATELVLEAVKKEVNKKRHPSRQLKREEAIERRFRSWHRSRKLGLFTKLVEATDGDTRKLFIETARRDSYDFLTVEDGEMYGYPKELLDEPLQDVYDRRTTTLDGSYKGEFISLRGKDGQIDQVLVPSSVKRVVEGPRISPLIAWKRDKAGKRGFIFERRTEPAASIHFRDGVLGALTVAYFAPDVRGKWPKNMAIRGSRTQFMGAAQLPVLALMRQGQLLNSGFVEAAESIAA